MVHVDCLRDDLPRGALAVGLVNSVELHSSSCRSVRTFYDFSGDTVELGIWTERDANVRLEAPERSDSSGPMIRRRSW